MDLFAEERERLARGMETYLRLRNALEASGYLPLIKQIEDLRTALFKARGVAPPDHDVVTVLLAYVGAEGIAQTNREPPMSIQSSLSTYVRRGACRSGAEKAAVLAVLRDSADFAPQPKKAGLFSRRTRFERLYSAWEAATPEERRRVLDRGSSPASPPELTLEQELEKCAWDLARAIGGQAPR